MHRPTGLQNRRGDSAVLDLIRLSGTVGIADVSGALGVTATAVRLRLDRLVESGLVERVSADPSIGRGRGRPAHGYRLTPKGRLTGGDNFQDLAMALWDEVRSVQHPDVRKGLLNRIGRRLADRCGSSVSGDTAFGRLEQVADLLRQRSVSCSVSADAKAGLAVLTSHSSPNPELADRDRGISSEERAMLEQLTRASVKLTECRLDGDACCRFTATRASGEDAAVGHGHCDDSSSLFESPAAQGRRRVPASRCCPAATDVLKARFGPPRLHPGGGSASNPVLGPPKAAEKPAASKSLQAIDSHPRRSKR
ncbi:MAG: helix-turn-helix transcriptional regulator [Planctomycetaceae bacterium]